MPRGGHKTSRAYFRLDFTGLPESPTPLHYYNKLTFNQQRFVDEFVATGDAPRAAQWAGYEVRGITTNLLSQGHIRCAIRERARLIADMASVNAVDVRRDLKAIFEADTTELSGIWKVPCRHCWGVNHQYQYTNAEFYYLEQAYSYGENNWPNVCLTTEYGNTIYNHAQAAYAAGKQHHALDIKGGDGYSRNRQINAECPQCHGQGESMAYICDTRKLSEGGKKLFKGFKLTNDRRIELLTIDRTHVREMLARDTMVGVEHKEISVNLPRTQEEFDQLLATMSEEDLENFVANIVTLTEGSEYQQVPDTTALPKPSGKFSRGG